MHRGVVDSWYPLKRPFRKFERFMWIADLADKIEDENMMKAFKSEGNVYDPCRE